MSTINAIIINGYSRGGTNLLWNILQSHPRICSPMYETGELFFEHIFPFKLVKPSNAKVIASWPIVARVGKRYLRKQFDIMKSRNFYSVNNNEKYEGVQYSEREIEESIICFKGVNSDVILNNLLEAIYGDVAHVVLVRNGYAVCNGWNRRGMSPKEAGRKYSSLYRKMMSSEKNAKIFIQINFEDILEDPFKVANNLFRELQLEPKNLPKLRLKSKPIVKAQGTHETQFGVQGSKYWLSPDLVREAIDPSVDIRQIEKLEDDARKEFEREAKVTMQALGYIK